MRGLNKNIIADLENKAPMVTERPNAKNRAEAAFFKWAKKEYPGCFVLKRGMPDFMVIDKKGNLKGFFEVKRDGLDWLRPEQKVFQRICQTFKIPYQVWKPIMGSERWKTWPESRKNMVLRGWI